MTEPKPTEALLGCPFCGGEAQLHDNDWCEPPEWSIYCSVCSAITPGNTDKTLAVATWNRRAAVPSPAIPEPTEAEIDAVATALFQQWTAEILGRLETWEQQKSFTKSSYRQMAKFAIAALASARSPAPEWRDISETDPADEIAVIVAWKPIGRGALVGEAYRHEGRWWWANESDGDYRAEPIFPEPQSYTPLPSPPKETT